MLGWPRISVYERKDFRLRIGFRNGHTKIVNLLSAVGGWARNHNSHRRTKLSFERCSGFLDHGERRIVRAVADKNDFELRIVLRKKGVDVFFQTVVDSTARDKDRDKGCECRVFLHYFGLQITHKSHPATKRNQTQPN